MTQFQSQSQAQARAQRSHRASRLMGGVSLASMLALIASAAMAQSTPAAPDTIVITGTSIRGAAPVGAAVVTVGQEQIEKTADQTVQQILQNVPSVVGLQSAGQGAFGSADGAGVDAPTIHGLGASASNSTLILIDGHRAPLSGLNHALVDPNILPPMALARVEVLADGASSIYGSDAVAGVINFITRPSYDGLEVAGQAGFANHYHTYSGGLIAGKKWDTGSAWVAYNYDYRSNLSGADRSFTRLNHLAQGGTNLSSYNCGLSTIKVGTTIYPAPYSSSNTLAATGAGICDSSVYNDILPSETRHSVMARITDDVNDRLTLSGDVVYSNLYEITQNLRGTASTTIFGPGSANAGQINPYFTLPAGVAATSETVLWDGDALLGPGAHTNVSNEAFYVHPNATYKLKGDWQATAAATIGSTTSRQQIIGALNGSAVNLALNGTTNSSGSLTTPSIPGTSVIVTQSLTTANALNPFLTAGNPTPASVLAGITNSTQTRLTRHNIQDLTLKFDGSVFQLPAGPVKLAVGGEYIHYAEHIDITIPSGIGPATIGSTTTNLDFARSVYSGYGELLVPVVSPDMNVPGMRKLDLSISGRYDHYSDFGNTQNPKIGANWEVMSGVKLRGAYATSFTAPSLNSVGTPIGQWGVTGESGFGNYGLGTVTIPYSVVPALAGVPGCTATATSCTIGTSVTGAQITGGNKGLTPQSGKSYSVGIDFTPTQVRGLRLSATWWHNEIQGGVTAPNPSVAVNSSQLINQVLTVFPSGATPAQIAALTAGLPTQTSALPANVYFVYNFQQRNVLNLWVEGLDFDASYRFNTDWGRFDVQTGGAYETKFNQQIGKGSPIYSVLNSTGANTTFPSIQFQIRSGVSWAGTQGVSASLFWSHTGAYKNWGGTPANPIVRNTAGLPIGGGDTVAANDTFDGHLQYDFQDKSGWASGAQIYVDVQNMFDKAPPFYNTGSLPAAGATLASGYDSFGGNPIGRVISIGARKKF
ncbi:MAG TPA: TonB-dependent receptor [Caulobacteraceae bacterium]|nr:TonB-dependent receptor [Caulobacteraceae bacterium]